MARKKVRGGARRVTPRKWNRTSTRPKKMPSWRRGRGKGGSGGGGSSG